MAPVADRPADGGPGRVDSRWPYAGLQLTMGCAIVNVVKERGASSSVLGAPLSVTFEGPGLVRDRAPDGFPLSQNLSVVLV